MRWLDAADRDIKKVLNGRNWRRWAESRDGWRWWIEEAKGQSWALVPQKKKKNIRIGLVMFKNKCLLKLYVNKKYNCDICARLKTCRHI